MIEFKCSCGNVWLLEYSGPMNLQLLRANPCIECGMTPYAVSKRPTGNYEIDREAMNANDIAIAKSLGIKL